MSPVRSYLCNLCQNNVEGGFLLTVEIQKMSELWKAVTSMLA